MPQSDGGSEASREGLLGGLFPSAYATARWPALDWLVLIALAIFALSNFIEPDIARKAEWLILAATVITAPRIIRGDPDGPWLYGAFLLAMFFMLSINAWASMHGAGGHDHNNFTRQHLRLFWCVIAGWWLGGTERRVLRILALALAGLLLAIVVNGGLGSWERLLSGQRVDFGIRNAQHTGILFATALMGLVALAPRFFRGHGGFRRTAGALLWAGLLVLAAMVVIGVQTRQVVFGLLIVAAFWVTVLIKARPRRLLAGGSLRLGLIAVVAVLLVVLPFSLLDTSSPLVRKSAQVIDSVQMFTSRAAAEVPRTSTTLRLMQWRAAVDAIKERPWLGHGAARDRVLKAATIPERFKRGFGHFHNGYLELWVSYGALGPLLFIGLLLLLALRLRTAWRAGEVATDIMAFGVSFLLFFAVVNVFESYVASRTGSHLMLFVGGAMYSLTLPGRRARSPRRCRMPAWLYRGADR